MLQPQWVNVEMNVVREMANKLKMKKIAVLLTVANREAKYFLAPVSEAENPIGNIFQYVHTKKCENISKTEIKPLWFFD